MKFYTVILIKIEKILKFKRGNPSGESDSPLNPVD